MEKESLSSKSLDKTLNGAVYIWAKKKWKETWSEKEKNKMIRRH